MMECSGLISMVFLEAMYPDMELSLRACAFMIRSMLADQPYSPVTRQHGELVRRSDTTTFSALSPSTSLMSLQRFSQAAFFSSHSFFSSSDFSMFKPSLVMLRIFLPAYSLSCWMAYSSMGSVMYRTSNPFFLRVSRNGADSTAFLDSPVMVDLLLVLLHAWDVVLEGSHVLA